jgi:hypothetical protein
MRFWIDFPEPIATVLSRIFVLIHDHLMMYKALEQEVELSQAFEDLTASLWKNTQEIIKTLRIWAGDATKKLPFIVSAHHSSSDEISMGDFFFVPCGLMNSLDLEICFWMTHGVSLMCRSQHCHIKPSGVSLRRQSVYGSTLPYAISSSSGKNSSSISRMSTSVLA